MKTDKKYPDLPSRDNLKAENDLLKMKLTTEFGMKGLETSSLDIETENQWLKHIFEFEKSYINSKRLKIYDYLERPFFKLINEINQDEITTELDRVLEILENKSIRLDTLCDYDDSIIYKFITEELFHEEIEDMEMEGMISCYCYEEFHPNHEYDLKQQTHDFFRTLLEKEWNDEFDRFQLDEIIEYKNKIFDREEFTRIIHSFQEENTPFKLKNASIENVEFNLESLEATSKGNINYQTNLINHAGNFEIHFIFDCQYWHICKLKLPGF